MLFYCYQNFHSSNFIQILISQIDHIHPSSNYPRLDNFNHHLHILSLASSYFMLNKIIIYFYNHFLNLFIMNAPNPTKQIPKVAFKPNPNKSLFLLTGTSSISS